MLLPTGANPDRDRDREHNNIAGMDPLEEDKSKKLNDDMVLFVRKRSEHEAPRYTARLKTILDIHQKRRKAATAREHKAHGGRHPEGRKAKAEEANKDNQDIAGQGKHRNNSKSNLSGSRDPDDEGRPRRRSRSFSLEPSDRCRRRRRRRRRRSCRRRRRSVVVVPAKDIEQLARQRRRRRRSCRRRRRRSGRRRRRRRSCRRRRRRRSCRRRRRRRC